MGTRNAVRKPSQTAYFVAMAGILGLLLVLCCYFLYFCVRRVKELSRQGLPEPVQSVRPPPPSAPYPVQPGVRTSASAMARLCQSPRGPRSPAALSPLSPRGPRSPAPVSPLSPRGPLSPAHCARAPRAPYTSPQRAIAQATRSNSLAPSHTRTVHPYTRSRDRAHTLPPPTIIPPKANSLTATDNTPASNLAAPRRKNDEVVRRTKKMADSNGVAKKHLSAPPQIVVDSR